ncbi:hypothetical protein K458DRAFT_397081 [Lentithecium fluviatile CBS 122367]|uniref:Uncharacterized protein n=1 Tax=Lentithecium fluviatile CBS 122367 TaxID=1168545 RepID=A0A6G1IE90_9PLEO|nr:hypothetical protein K458DRAFT_397081 [Lentithecium fluviatile CBS 122367]
MCLRSLFGCGFFSYKRDATACTHIEEDTILPEPRLPEPKILRRTNCQRYAISRTGGPQTTQRRPRSAVQVQNPSSHQQPQDIPRPPEFAHLENATPVTCPSQTAQTFGSTDMSNRPQSPTESLFGWDEPLANMIPDGYKIEASESRNQLRLARRGPYSPVNSFQRQPSLFSINEVMETDGDARWKSPILPSDSMSQRDLILQEDHVPHPPAPARYRRR